MTPARTTRKSKARKNIGPARRSSQTCRALRRSTTEPAGAIMAKSLRLDGLEQVRGPPRYVRCIRPKRSAAGLPWSIIESFPPRGYSVVDGGSLKTYLPGAIPYEVGTLSHGSRPPFSGGRQVGFHIALSAL